LCVSEILFFLALVDLVTVVLRLSHMSEYCYIDKCLFVVLSLLNILCWLDIYQSVTRFLGMI
jgi:uncharacterized membrane protein (DUF373 family)